MPRLLGITSLCSILTCCQVEEMASRYQGARADLHMEVVPEKEPMPANPNMLQIARSLPIMDFTWEGFQRIGLIESSENELNLIGDGAQSSAHIRLLNHEDPIRIQLDYGPHFDGFGFRMPLEHYTFERVSGGWKRLAFEVTYHGPIKSYGTFSAPLSEKENRKKIEKITGKPYGYHFVQQ